MIAVWVALAGGAGAMARFAVDGYVRARCSSAFPWGTVLINVSGSLALGLLTGWVLFRGGSADAGLVVGTGFCGGYTTFSTTSFETVRLAQRGQFWPAVGNALGTAVLSLTAAAIGLVVMR